jgi:hypothetical protein
MSLEEGRTVRTGDEPTHARSPLRLRLGLAAFGLLCAVAGVVLSAGFGSALAVAVFVVIGLVALVDLMVVVVRIRQGPHWQPGRAVPPYRPVSTRGGRRQEARDHRAVPMQTRRHRYLLLMSLCVLLLVLSWAWVRSYSTTAAAMMTVVAMVIPALAAVVANAGSPITRSRRR